MIQSPRTLLVALAGSAALLLTGSAALLLTGCGLQQTASTLTPGVALHGVLHGGRQPIAGATIQFYAAGSTGYGSAYPYSSGSSLLGTNTVTTNSNGYFTITNDYTCPSPTTPVYIVAYGGNPGLPGNATNDDIVLMAALGPCGNLSSATSINIDEVTTIASVWALSPFMTGVANIGAPATNLNGLANAFATVNKLASIGGGSAPGPALPSGATAPIAKINTLANILASCVNSSGGHAGDSGACGTLFTDTTVNSVAPADTVSAALNLAQHPNLQTSSLINLSTPESPFQPTLTAAPNDFSLVITYTGSGLSAPKGLAADAAGNIWIANSSASSVTELDNAGAPLSGTNGFTVGALSGPGAIAIDTAGNAWVTVAPSSTVYRISSNGVTNAAFTGGGLSSPTALAIDAASNVWVANAGSSSLTEIQAGGAVTSFTNPGASSSTAIAIDPQ
ncbi:MAG: hypothetical protein V4555_06190 [Acidobacteriota bacterium]